MAEVNGVGQNQEIGYLPKETAKTLKKAHPDSINRVDVDSHGKGTNVQSNTNFNLYGSDISNFEKFKGNDKHDAMRMTQTAANDVKRAFMQLQHEFPDVVIVFEPMPDPKTCGKKREGFFTYQQALENWKDTALFQIANARETSTKDLGQEIIANDDKNALMNAGVTLATGQAVMENDNENALILAQMIADGTAEVINEVKNTAGQIIRTIKNAEGEIVKVVQDSTGKILNEVQFQGWYSRAVTRNQGVRTRETVKETAKQTQELNGISDKISDVLLNSVDSPHTTATISSISNMRNRILQSNAPYDVKKELLTHLASFSTQKIISSKELKAEQERIENALNN